MHPRYALLYSLQTVAVIVAQDCASDESITVEHVNRIEHPGGTRDWSAAAIDKQRKDLAEFAARWKKIDVKGWPVPKQVDYKLIGSALSRVQWELDVNPRWKRDPTFYIAQTLTPVVEALTVPGQYEAAR